MTTLSDRVSLGLLRRAVFTLLAVVFLGLFLLQAWRIFVLAVAGWFENALGLFDEFEAAHRIHMFVFGLIFWPAVVGMLAQIRSPRKHLASQWMALAPFVALLAGMALTDFWKPLPIILLFGSMVLVATLLHPAGLDLARSFGSARANRVLLALMVVAAVPLLAYAATQVGLQTGAIDAGHDHTGPADHEKVHQEHVEGGHYTTNAVFPLVVVLLGFVGSLRPDGWWVPAWLTGIMVAFFGLASVAFPETASSAGTMWGALAVIWAVTFVTAAELTQDQETPTLLGKLRAGRATRQ